MDPANTIVMQEAKMEELQAQLNKWASTYATLLKRYNAVLELAEKYVPEEILKKALNTADTK